MDYNDIFKLIASDLQQVEDVIEENIQSEVPLVYEISKYLLGSGGKRLRPSVLLLASGSCGLLEGEELLAARSGEASDAGFAQEVAFWQDRLAPLLDQIDPQTPRADPRPEPAICDGRRYALRERPLRPAFRQGLV